MPIPKFMAWSTVAVAMCSILAVGCSTARPSGRDEDVVASPIVSVAPTTSLPATRSAPRADSLAAAFAKLDRTIPARVGVVVIAGERSRAFGTAIAGPAWSTIKAPLAIAALRHADTEGTDVAATVDAAITNSDNASAETLWASLGSPESAARQVQAVLADTGDSETIVTSQRVRAGYTPFGQTVWPLRDQARFGWHLRCLKGASPVVSAMQSITASQQWGLASIDASASKGGWGPDRDGAYLVRQFGVLSGDRGSTGVALVAAPEDGTFASGVAAIDTLAKWVAAHLVQLPQATCRN